MKLKILALTLCFSLFCVGCANRAAQAPIPGAVNQFDSDTYLSLITAQAVIDQTKADLANGTFSPSVVSAVKTATNKASIAYNAALAAYTAYHLAVSAGTATTAQQQTAQSAVNTLNVSVGQIATVKAGK